MVGMCEVAPPKWCLGHAKAGRSKEPAPCGENEGKGTIYRVSVNKRTMDHTININDTPGSWT